MQRVRQKRQLRQVELGWEGEDALLSLSGELDVATAPELRSSVGTFFEHSGQGATLVIDLAAVTFVDSTTLGVLVGAIRAAEQRSATVVIRNQGPAIQRVFELTGLDQLLTTGR